MTIDELLQIFCQQGSAEYFGESITFRQHSLQAAHFVALAGASDALIAAALLHDIGHLIGNAPAHLEDWHTDAEHEAVGARFLQTLFPLTVTEPVRLHVAAKRYLCATQATYLRQLSAASIRTLNLQRGPLSAADVARFEAEPFHTDALLLRRCDDQAKIQGLVTPDFPHYKPLLQCLALQRLA
jgi:predicted HD phosphohydrolase